MNIWFYQINQQSWPPNRYRLEIWENQTWSWPIGRMHGGGVEIETGDVVVFFYAPSGGDDPGFYGWAIVQEFVDFGRPEILFRPVSPSDFLKMCPWWDEEAKALADDIRGKFKQITLWRVDHKDWMRLSNGIRFWLGKGNK